MGELKPCPFCGHAMGVADFATSELGACLVCVRCGASSDWCDTRSDAATAWNRRFTHHQPVTPAGGEEYRIGMFDRWDAYAKELGYTGICDALSSLAILKTNPPLILPEEKLFSGHVRNHHHGCVHGWNTCLQTIAALNQRGGDRG